MLFLFLIFVGKNQFSIALEATFFSKSGQSSLRNIKPLGNGLGRKINIINETGISTNLDTNYQIIKELLAGMGIEIHCRYLGDATCEEMKRFLEAPINVLASDNAEGRALKEWLTAKYGCTFLDEPLPVGFHATKRWLKKLGRIFDCEEAAERMIAGQEKLYQEEIEKLKPFLQGKRIFMTTINENVDWILETADAIGMKFVRIGVMNYLRQEAKVTDHPDKYEIDENFDWTKMRDIIRELKPDIVLSNYTYEEEGDYMVDTIPMSPVVGFHSGIQLIGRWVKLLNQKEKGAWMNDRALFEKYYS